MMVAECCISMWLIGQLFGVISCGSNVIVSGLWLLVDNDFLVNHRLGMRTTMIMSNSDV